MRHLVTFIQRWMPLVAVLGFTACNTCPECPPFAIGSGAGSNGEQKLAPGLEYPDVCQRELNCAKADFPDHFVPYTLKPQDLQDLVHYVNVTALDQVLVGYNHIKHGIKIHYGAEKVGPVVKLRYALQLVELDKQEDDVFYVISPVGGSVHPINSNGSLGNAMDTADWNRNMRRTYLDGLKVFRTNDSIPKAYPDVLRSYYDVSAYTFRVNDIDSLINDNPGTTRLNIHTIAVPSVRRIDGLEDDWFHHVALVAAKPDQEFIADSARQSEDRFNYRALDLGSPCPPSCVLARFYRYGLAPRSTCRCH